MKKVLVLVLSLVLVATMALSGTIAYLTSTDSDVNVMTVGNVEIKQLEYQREVKNGKWVSTGETDKYGYTPDKLEPFESNKPLYPAFFADGQIKWDDRSNGEHQQSWGQIGAPGSNQLFDESVVGAQDKFVFVENTGSSDAYIRTWFAFELGSVAAEDFEKVIRTNGDETHWSWVKDGFVIEVEGNKYLAYYADYMGPTSNPTGVLAAGSTTYPSLLQVYMAPEATNENVAAIDGNANKLYDIMVVSQGVQTINFPDAKTALNAAFGAPTAEYAATVFGGISFVKDDVSYLSPEDSKELIDNLEKGKTVVVGKNSDAIAQVEADAVIKGNGSEVILSGNSNTAAGNHGYIGFVPPKGGDVTVSDMSFSGQGFVELGHYGEGGGDYVAENLTIENLKATWVAPDHGVNVASAFAHYGNATLKNCTMTGTTYLEDDPSVDAYDAGFPNATKTVIEGGKYGRIYLWAQAHVTVNNAEIGEIDSAAITTRNLGKLTIGAGAKVGTINLIPTGTYKPALVIEDGAQVGEIIYKGVNYTVESWKAANP